MNIAGINGVTALSSLQALGKIQNNTPANGFSSNGSTETISQIRDQVDKLATSGQLSSLQQLELIESGFQDMNANNPSYQPVGQTGYTRSTTGTFDFAGTLEGIGSFDSAHGNLAGAATFNSLADLFGKEKSSSGLDVAG